MGSPPPFIVTEFGRANIPQEPMFYGSAGCHSTILELAPNLGDRLAISKWRVTQNFNVVPVGYTERAFKGKAGIVRWPEIPWAKQHAEDAIGQLRENQVVQEFLAREFTKKVSKRQAWQYKLSSAYSQLILDAHRFGVDGGSIIEIAGIVYPSTPNEANADNVALRHSITNSLLEFVSVQYVEISKKTNLPEYSMTGLDFADGLSEAGEILWRNTFPNLLIAGTDHSVDIKSGPIAIKDNKGNIVGNL